MPPSAIVGRRASAHAPDVSFDTWYSPLPLRTRRCHFTHAAATSHSLLHQAKGWFMAATTGPVAERMHGEGETVGGGRCDDSHRREPLHRGGWRGWYACPCPCCQRPHGCCRCPHSQGEGAVEATACGLPSSRWPRWPRSLSHDTVNWQPALAACGSGKGRLEAAGRRCLMFHGSRQQREQHRADNDMYDGGTVVGAVFRHATVNPPAARARARG